MAGFSGGRAMASPVTHVYSGGHRIYSGRVAVPPGAGMSAEGTWQLRVFREGNAQFATCVLVSSGLRSRARPDLRSAQRANLRAGKIRHKTPSLTRGSTLRS